MSDGMPRDTGGAPGPALPELPELPPDHLADKLADQFAETLDAPGSEPPESSPPSSSRRWSTQRLPVVDPSRYRVVAQVAQGGIGRVMRAWDAQMDRPVAVKELLHTDRFAEQDRFVREALVTGRLQHPAIVPVYEAARWPNGAPFYSMKLVSGRSLADVIAEAGTLEQRLPLLPHVIAVAQAIAYAHGERIIHRDLKPANVLVGPFGETVVIDWGLAKELQPPGAPADDAPATIPPPSAEPTPGAPDAATLSASDVALTQHGAIVGTPGYMPPEQAEGEQVDERADVYALGAILYHVLAGEPPYTGPTPAAILAQVRAGPPLPLAALERGIPEDLLAIVAKAMAHDPADRYPTAKELADDLLRFQAGQLVGARRYSSRQLALRFARRHRRELAMIAASLAVLAFIGAMALRRVFAERDRAEIARQDAVAAEGRALERADELTLVQARAALDRDPAEALSWLRTLSPSFQGWDAARVIAADAQARGLPRLLRGHRGSANGAVFTRDHRSLITISDDRTVRVWRLGDGSFRELHGHQDEIWGVVLAPDESRVATAGKDGSVRIWDLVTGAVRELEGHTRPVSEVAFLPDGKRLLSASLDGTVRLWDLETGAHRVVASDAVALPKAAFSRDRARVATVGRDGSLRIDELESGARHVPPDAAQLVHAAPRRIVDIELSPDGALLAVGCEDTRVRLWDPARDAVRDLEGSRSPITNVAFSPDGAHLVSAARDGSVRLWTVATREARPLPGFDGELKDLRFSPDGRWIAAGATDRTARLWRVETGEHRIVGGGKDAVQAVAFSSDSAQLAVAAVDGVVRLLDVDLGPSRLLGQHEGAVHALAVAPDGARVATGGKGGALRLFDPEVGELSQVAAHEGAIHVVAFSPAGDLLASAGDDGVVRLWDEAGAPARTLAARGATRALAFSPDGARLAAVGEAAHIWDLVSGAALPLRGHEGRVSALAFSPDGETLATAGADHAVRLWDVRTGASRFLGVHRDRATAVAFSPDGKLLASGGADHELRIWDLAAGTSQVLSSGGVSVQGLAFLPDGAQLMAFGRNSTVRIVDVRNEAPLQHLRGHEGNVQSARLSPDGRLLVSASADGTARIFDLRTRESRALRGHTGEVLDARFLPDGRGLITVGADGTVRFWADDLPRDPEALRAWIEEAAP